MFNLPLSTKKGMVGGAGGWSEKLIIFHISILFYTKSIKYTTFPPWGGTHFPSLKPQMYFIKSWKLLAREEKVCIVKWAVS